MKIVCKIIALLFFVTNLDAAEAPPKPPASPTQQVAAPNANQKMLPLPVAGLGTVNIPFDLNTEDPIAVATFSEAINTQLATNPAFILARVTTVLADGRRNVEYYEAPGINYHLYGPNNLRSKNPAEIRLYGLRSPLQAFIEWPIHYFILYDAAGNFEYLCSDYDLNKGDDKTLWNSIFLANYLSNLGGRIIAQINLSAVYYTPGVNQNLPLSKKYLEKAAMQELNQDIKFNALIRLGIIYNNEKNYLKAREYSEPAAVQNIDMRLKFDAFLVLGATYFFEKNYSRARTYYEQVAAQNINRNAKFAALNSLGSIYLEEKNYSKAREFYEQGAKQDENLSIKNKAIERLKEIQDLESKKRAVQEEGAQKPSAKKPKSE